MPYPAIALNKYTKKFCANSFSVAPPKKPYKKDKQKNKKNTAADIYNVSNKRKNSNVILLFLL